MASAFGSQARRTAGVTPRVVAGDNPYPFVKWAGGKSRLLPTFDQYFPDSLSGTAGRYFEPFVGGGAVFFHLLPANAVLSDLNPELINCYQVIRDDLESLIALLARHVNDKAHFYKVRAQDTRELSPAERAARLIFLNKTCFNGLYRVNSRGQFNVPFGRYLNPRICDADNLHAVSTTLQGVELILSPFEKVLKRARKGDFVYLDPPYQPVSATANFTGYTAGAFGLDDQEKLAGVFRELSRRGCLVMLSNSESPSIRQLYAGFRIEQVHASRAINCRADRRGRVTELLVLNYDQREALIAPP